MPLTKEEKDLIKKIEKEYRKKGYSKDEAKHVANAVVYQRKRKLELM